MADFMSFLGRLSFGCQLMPFLKPFLGPMFAWTSIGSNFGYAPIPLVDIMALKFVADRIMAQHVTYSSSACSETAQGTLPHRRKS